MRRVGLLAAALSMSLWPSVPTPIQNQETVFIRQQQKTSTRLRNRKNKCCVKQGQRRAVKASNVQRNKAHH